MKLHRHMEDGLVVVSCGEEYDCPAERGCWFEGEESEIGREVRTERGAVWAGRECPKSRREDGKHSWVFDGDDPYVVCAFCDERRDALTGRTIDSGATEGEA